MFLVVQMVSEAVAVTFEDAEMSLADDDRGLGKTLLRTGTVASVRKWCRPTGSVSTTELGTNDVLSPDSRQLFNL